MTGAAARPEPVTNPGCPAPPRLPPNVTRIRVIRDDNDGNRAKADFGDVATALVAVKAHMRLPGVYSIMITFDE